MADDVRLIPKTREAVLRYLIEDPAAGRSMIQISDATATTSGALYPTLAEMEQDVVVTSRDGASRNSGRQVTGSRVYQLTPRRDRRRAGPRRAVTCQRPEAPAVEDTDPTIDDEAPTAQEEASGSAGVPPRIAARSRPDHVREPSGVSVQF